MLPIRFISLLRSHVSWAKVARELILALDRLGVKLTVEENKEPQFEDDYQLPSALESLEKRVSKYAAVDFTFVVPDQYPQVFSSRLRTAFLVFEATKWPRAWVEAAMRHLDAVVVPSQFCRETLLDSGLTGLDVHVIPHGVDPNVYSPGDREPAGSRDELRLLYIGTPAMRKGLDVFLHAVEAGFPQTEGLHVTIKTNNWDSRPDSYNGWQAHVHKLKERGFRIKTITETLSEGEMAELYREADLLCQPFRGEGFGMPILEAMACGTPTVVTAWSGPLDFVTPNNAFLLNDFVSRDCGMLFPIDFAPVDSAAQMVEPSAASCAEILASVAANRDQLKSRSVAAAKTAEQWTWERAAKMFLRDVVEPLQH